jgi:lactoylglutathione lyase
MQVAQHGIILFVEHYAQCVAFYRDALALPIAYVQDTLTCFELGSSYLMVEQGGVSSITQKTRAQNPTVLRFNVHDIRAAAQALQAKGVQIELMSFDWGDIAVFHDPDGNRCELKNARIAD